MLFQRLLQQRKIVFFLQKSTQSISTCITLQVKGEGGVRLGEAMREARSCVLYHPGQGRL